MFTIIFKKLTVLFYAAILLLISGAFGYLIHSEGKELYDISVNGNTTIGTVIDFKYSERRGRKGRIKRSYDHLISYDNNRKWFDLGKQYPMRSQFYITYSLKDFKIARVSKDNSLWKLILDEFGWFGILFLPAMFLFFGYVGILRLWEFFFISSKDIEV